MSPKSKLKALAADLVKKSEQAARRGKPFLGTHGRKVRRAKPPAPLSFDRTTLARQAFLGVLPILWGAIKEKLGRTDGCFLDTDADKGIALMSDREIEECVCLEGHFQFPPLTPPPHPTQNQ